MADGKEKICSHDHPHEDCRKAFANKHTENEVWERDVGLHDSIIKLKSDVESLSKARKLYANTIMAIVVGVLITIIGTVAVNIWNGYVESVKSSMYNSDLNEIKNELKILSKRSPSGGNIK